MDGTDFISPENRSSLFTSFHQDSSSWPDECEMWSSMSVSLVINTALVHPMLPRRGPHLSVKRNESILALKSSLSLSGHPHPKPSLVIYGGS